MWLSPAQWQYRLMPQGTRAHSTCHQPEACEIDDSMSHGTWRWSATKRGVLHSPNSLKLSILTHARTVALLQWVEAHLAAHEVEVALELEVCRPRAAISSKEASSKVRQLRVACARAEAAVGGLVICRSQGARSPHLSQAGLPIEGLGEEQVLVEDAHASVTGRVALECWMCPGKKSGGVD